MPLATSPVAAYFVRSTAPPLLAISSPRLLIHPTHLPCTKFLLSLLNTSCLTTLLRRTSFHQLLTCTKFLHSLLHTSLSHHSCSPNVVSSSINKGEEAFLVYIYKKYALRRYRGKLHLVLTSEARRCRRYYVTANYAFARSRHNVSFHCSGMQDTQRLVVCNVE